jgi:hypothetical protein
MFTFLLSERKRMNFPHSAFWWPSWGSGSSKNFGNALFWIALEGLNEIIDQLGGLQKETIVVILLIIEHIHQGMKRTDTLCFHEIKKNKWMKLVLNI